MHVLLTAKQSSPFALKLTASLLCASLCTATPALLHAQSAYAKVLDATPVYHRTAVSQKSCDELQQSVRCDTTTTYEEQLIGYDVLYEYAGQQHVQRMAHDPGMQVPIAPDGAPALYSSQPAVAPSAVSPGRKSYGSTQPGAPILESIELRNTEQLPVYIHAPAPRYVRPH